MKAVVKFTSVRRFWSEGAFDNFRKPFWGTKYCYGPIRGFRNDRVSLRTGEFFTCVVPLSGNESRFSIFR